MSELSASLMAACISGNLSEAISLYNVFVHKHPLAKPSTLSQIAVLSAKNSHPSILTFCFSEGLTINPDPWSMQPVILAPSLSSRCFSSMAWMLTNTSKWTAHHAGNVELANFLLDHGADPNNGYALGHYEALIWAIVGPSASPELVKLLLTRGTMVKGTGSLIAAAEHGNLDALRLLVEHELKNGACSLEEVQEYGEEDSGKLDDQGTPLYKGAAQCHLRVVDFLLKKGADPKFRNRKGRSVMDIAVENGYKDIAERIRMVVLGVEGLTMFFRRTWYNLFGSEHLSCNYFMP